MAMAQERLLTLGAHKMLKKDFKKKITCLYGFINDFGRLALLFQRCDT